MAKMETIMTGYDTESDLDMYEIASRLSATELAELAAIRKTLDSQKLEEDHILRYKNSKLYEEELERLAYYGNINDYELSRVKKFYTTVASIKFAKYIIHRIKTAQARVDYRMYDLSTSAQLMLISLVLPTEYRDKIGIKTYDNKKRIEYYQNLAEFVGFTSKFATEEYLRFLKSYL